MPKMRRADLPFWQQLVIASMRVAVRIALATRGLVLREMKHMLQVAIYQELQTQGYTIHAMSLELQCAPATVRAMARMAGAREAVEPTNRAIATLLSALLERPLSLREIEPLLPQIAEFDAAGVAVRMLRQEGWVEEVPGSSPSRFRLAPGASWPPASALETPLAETELAFSAGLLVLQRVNRGEITREALFGEATISAYPRRSIERSLSMLIEQALIEEGAGGELRLPARRILAVPTTWQPRVRLGLLDLFRRLGDFSEAVIQDPSSIHFAQRSVDFRARRDDLLTFIPAHRRQVLEACEAMEEAAQGAGEPCVMFWGLTPLGGSEGGAE